MRHAQLNLPEILKRCNVLNKEAKKSEIRQLNVTRCKMLNEEALRVLETLDGWVQLLPLHISRLFSYTFENVCSQTFQSTNPFKRFSGSHWGRSSLKPRSKERVWRARKVPLFANNLVFWTHYLVTFPCNFYLISFIMYILSCILLIIFILYLVSIRWTNWWMKQRCSWKPLQSSRRITSMPPKCQTDRMLKSVNTW